MKFIDRIKVNLAKIQAPKIQADLFERDAIEEVILCLNSEAALTSIEEDPYWPKWNSPWWWITLLWEMGLTKRIPRKVLDKFANAINTHYLHLFPVRQEEFPPGIDVYRHIICHCALGTAMQILKASDFEVYSFIPWAREWFLRYQLPDGGLNCDESVYTKETPHSSVVSTLPALEATLACAGDTLTHEEEVFVDRGAKYLLDRKLWRSVSGNGSIIRQEWRLPCFPRFYHYDLMRGLRYLIHWARIRKVPLPSEAIEESIGLIEKQMGSDGSISPDRRCFEESLTRGPDETGSWNAWLPAQSFALLDRVSDPGRPSLFLTREWQEILSELIELDRQRLLV